jgi:hypothetical protein
VSTKPNVLATVPTTTVKPHFPPAPIADDALARQPNSVTTELVELYATSKIRFSSVLLDPVVELWNLKTPAVVPNLLSCVPVDSR